jgi:hypothetical protein
VVVDVTPISQSEVGSVQASSLFLVSRLNCSITTSDGTVLSSNTGNAAQTELLMSDITTRRGLSGPPNLTASCWARAPRSGWPPSGCPSPHGCGWWTWAAVAARCGPRPPSPRRPFGHTTGRCTP